MLDSLSDVLFLKSVFDLQTFCDWGRNGAILCATMQRADQEAKRKCLCLCNKAGIESQLSQQVSKLSECPNVTRLGTRGIEHVAVYLRLDSVAFNSKDAIWEANLCFEPL